MWLMLKVDYVTKKGEIHFDSWNIARIKRGAPIIVRLDFPGLGFKFPISSFMFSSGSLDHLRLDDLELPKTCSMGQWGDIFCINTKEFFSLGGHKYLKHQIKYCPLCGAKINQLPPLPIPANDNFAIKKERT